MHFVGLFFVFIIENARSKKQKMMNELSNWSRPLKKCLNQISRLKNRKDVTHNCSTEIPKQMKSFPRYINIIHIFVVKYTAPYKTGDMRVT